MANRPFHELTELIASKIKEIFERERLKPNKDRFNGSVEGLVTAIADYLIVANPKTPEELEEIVEELKGLQVPRRYPDYNWTGHLIETRNQYNKVFSLYSQFTDIEKTAHRNERKSQTRALIFRILTTLGVGLSIMAIYWFADYWGLSMPLSRKI